MKRKHLLLAGGTLTAAAAAIATVFWLLPFRLDFADQQSRLNTLTDRFFKQEVSSSTLNLHYTLADPENYGLADVPVRLGAISETDLSDSRLLTENYQADLASIDRSALSSNDQFTYDVMGYLLDTYDEGLDWYYYQEPLSPSLGVQAQLPILLAEYAFYTEKDVTDYLTLLSQTDDYFQSVLDFEQKKAEQSLFMSDATLDAITDQCIDFLNESEDSYLDELFQEKVLALPGLMESQKQSYIEVHQKLLTEDFFPAYELLVNGLMALKGSGTNPAGLAGLKDGTAYYAYLIRNLTGSDRTPEAIQSLLEDKRSGYSTQIQSLIAKNPSLLSSMDMPMPTETPDNILFALKQNISRDFPELPDTTFTVRSVHPSLAKYCSPAFYLTPPVDRMTENTIYINETYGYSGAELFTTLAHEGYPGHLYQTVYSHANCQNPLQSIINIGGYTEGWATYAEMYSYSLTGLSPAVAELLRLNKAWTLNLYCTIDVGVHYYGWGAYDVYEFLNGYGIDNLNVSGEIFQSIVEDPANYLKYYIGFLEFEALRDRTQNALGDNFDLQGFHKELLSLGPAPFTLLQKEIDAYIASKD